ncbi:putative ring finger protein [Botrytis fragariae]|uniref:Putative ring finger protein n=1 Tax=Botrytis fragariae TaxID=1964551 RepID=A0A8H6ECR3_9HELO|nr:putative ring finger protein [Botrytis fragariae]KAF5867662.1 putative ring finger protein [Botrytis fragariae]
MADNPSPEIRSWSDAQQNVFDHHSAWFDSFIQSQQMANISQNSVHGVNGATRRPTLGWFRTRREAWQSSENHAEIEVGSQTEGEEARQSSENHAETVVNSQAEGGEVRLLEDEGQPNPPPSIFEDDTMIKRNCYEDFRLENIENKLLPVSDCHSDHCPICQEKYNTTLDASTVVKDIRYCDDCQRSFTMKPDTSNSHKACTMPKCSHVFGRYCIIQWLKDNSTCPLCRDEVDFQ